MPDAIMSAMRRKPENYRPLLSIESDAKTVKGSKQGYLTAIMYLAPSDTSGVIDVCSYASAGCKYSCIFTTGLAGVMPNINQLRIAKTKYMVSNRAAFLASLEYDIETLILKARKRKLKPAVRLNGTSDLPWIARAMAKRFPKVQFYDYTKIPRPWQRQTPNYHLTFSHSEVNYADCLRALEHGISVSVVFGIPKGHPLPPTWHGYPVFNGDTNDLRFLDPKGAIIGLYAKGKAKKDCTGFTVRDLHPHLIQIGA